MITVVVCTYNRSSSLRTTLDSLGAMSVDSLAWELLVIDNNSEDDTQAVVAEFATSFGDRVRYIFEERQGLSHARNRGIAEARGEIVAFTDDDVLVDPGWLAALSRTFNSTDCIGVGGRSYPLWSEVSKPHWVDFSEPHPVSPGPFLLFDLGDEPKPTRVAPWGLNMAFRKAAFTKYGVFRTDLGVNGAAQLYGEDTEFGDRLLQNGEKIAYAPDAIVHHPVPAKRATREYVLESCFNRGRTSVIQGNFPAGMTYFGVPRWQLRKALTCAIGWWLAIGGRKRFWHKQRVYEMAGEITEIHQRWRRTQIQPAPKPSQPESRSQKCGPSAPKSHLTHNSTCPQPSRNINSPESPAAMQRRDAGCS